MGQIKYLLVKEFEGEEHVDVASMKQIVNEAGCRFKKIETENSNLKTACDTYKKEMCELKAENNTLHKKITELEHKMAEKEALLDFEDDREELSEDYTFDELVEKCWELEDRYRSACVKINRLHTVIDALVHTYVASGEAGGL